MICRTCQKEKDESQFSKYGDEKKYFYKQCKECLKERHKITHQKASIKIGLDKKQKTKEQQEQMEAFITLLRKEGKIK